MAIAFVALLVGCRNENNHGLPFTPSMKERDEKKDSQVDTSEEDTMEAFYERMRRWDALHGGMRQRESDK